MFDLKIDRLTLNLANAAGHEHRVEAITRLALDLTAERLPMHLAAMGIDSLGIEPINLRLDAMSDEDAAERIAEALVEALTLKLKT